MLTLRDEVKLHYQIVDNGRADWIIATHGIGEHSGRNSFLIEHLSSQYNILQYDLRGHGQSEGRRAYANSIMDYVDDLEEVIKLVLSFAPQSYSLFGHSMGALVTSALVQRGLKTLPRKVFLSSPPVGLPGWPGKLVAKIPKSFFSVLAKIPLSIPLKGMVDINYLSHNKDVREEYLLDRNNTIALHSRLLLSLVATSKKVFSRSLGCSMPLFVVVGQEDGIVSPQALIKYFSDYGPHCHLKVVPGGYHELHNEIDPYRQEYIDFLTSAFCS